MCLHSSNDKQTQQINNKMSEREKVCKTQRGGRLCEGSLSLPLKTLNMQEAAAMGESK